MLEDIFLKTIILKFLKSRSCVRRSCEDEVYGIILEYGGINKFQIECFNKISELNASNYDYHAILARS